jgi:hypothetical protein
LKFATAGQIKCLIEHQQDRWVSHFDRIAEKFEPVHLGCYHGANGQTQFHRTALTELFSEYVAPWGLKFY